MTGPDNCEKSRFSAPEKTERITFSDLMKCVAVGLAALAALSFLSVEQAHAHFDERTMIRDDDKVAEKEECEKEEAPPARERLENVKDRRNWNHLRMPILNRLQRERNLRQAMYDEEGTWEVLRENSRQTAMVIKPEHARTRTAVSPRRLREIINAYYGEQRVKVDDDPILSRMERNFAYRLKTRYGIGLTGQEDVDDTKASTAVTLFDALMNLEVYQMRRDVRVALRASEDVSKLSSLQVLRNEPDPINFHYRIKRKARKSPPEATRDSGCR